MRIFRKKIAKSMASFVLVNMLVQIYAPLQVFALTGGPSQSSMSRHKPVASTEMVDVFTGDFKYDIPLFTLPGPDGGYPFNLSYNSNVKMDQEASWVGLGWSLGPGAINRELNGVPDEFNGDKVKVQQHFKTNKTEGLTWKSGGGYSIIGLGYQRGVYWNTYNGVGHINNFSFGLSYGGGVSQSTTTDSQNGLTAGFSYFLAHQGITKNYTSQEGLASIAYTENNGVFFGGAKSLGLSQTGAKGLPSVAMPTTFKGENNGWTSSPLSTGEYYDYSTSLNSSFANTSYDSYGLFNFQNMPSDGGERVRMDFNRERERDILVNKDMKNLAVPRLTPDRFFVSSAGLQGAFKAYRTELGRVKDAKVKSTGTMKRRNANFNAPFHSNGDVDFEVRTGQWEIRNKTSATFDYVRNGASKNEPFYLKMENDMSSVGEDDLKYIGGTEVGRFDLTEMVNSNLYNDHVYGSYRLKGDLRYELNRDVITKFGADSYRPFNKTFRTEQRKRSTAIKYLKNKEIDDATPEYNIYYTNENGTTGTPLNRDELPDHPAGYTVLNKQGARYTYGLPVYNSKQVYATFSTDKVFTSAEGNPNSTEYGSALSLKAKIKGTQIYENTTVPKYIHGQEDADADDADGYSSQFLQRTEIPDYAHSYLLTSVLGSDYVDVLSDGASEDDLGYYVGFEYQKTDGSYKWRAPFNQAMFSEGKNKASVKDNIAAYTYGEKELYYLKIAETKTHIAEFIISDRKDARGADNEFQDSKLMVGVASRLDSIKLYTKEEYNKKSSDYAPVPLKTVHFEYTYDLCGDVDNNDGSTEIGKRYTDTGELLKTDVNNNKGKLTLKRVYYTYKNNRRGEFSPYEFDYHEDKIAYPGENPDYEEFMVDRWGDYSYDESRDEFFKSGGNSAAREKYNNQIWNANFPYVNQNKALRDVQTSVWNLKELTLPTGAKIKIDYEADDYAYVQDKKAMRMFKVLGLEQNNEDPSRDYVNAEAEEIGNSVNASKTKVFFELDKNFFENEYDDMKDKYLGDIGPDGGRKMFFDVDMTLKDVNVTNALTQSIKGWASVEDLGFDVENGQCVRGWVKVIKDEVYGDKDASKHFFLDPIVNTFQNISTGDNFKSTGYTYHPFTLEAYEYMLESMPAFSRAFKGTGKDKDKSDGFSSTDPVEVEKMARKSSKLSGSNELRFLYRDPFRVMSSKGFAERINPTKSVIRLFDPTSKKLGGGSRVKKITLSDNWSSDTDGAEEEAEYGQVYNYTKQEEGKVISSGVASYEPIRGKEENPFFRVKRYLFERKLTHHRRMDIEYPLNESYYPVAMVGYSTVTVTSLSTDEVAPVGATVPPLDSRLTSGAVRYEFYTYKDFPIITEEVPVEVNNVQKYFPDLPSENPLSSGGLISEVREDVRDQFNDLISFRKPSNESQTANKFKLGNPFDVAKDVIKTTTKVVVAIVKEAVKGIVNLFTANQASVVLEEITASQGYQVTTNDMHGKLKRVTYLEQNANGEFDDKGSPYVQYNYRSTKKLIIDPFTKKTISVDILNNKVEVLNRGIMGSSPVYATDYDLMGMDWEVALDNREKNTKIENVMKEYWVGKKTRKFFNEERIATSVFNKAFHMHGILQSVVSYDGQAKTITKNKVYDPLTGQVVLSTVQNQYDQNLYQYNEPAYLSYEEMGSAIENLGLEFGGTLNQLGSSVAIDPDGVKEYREQRFKVTSTSTNVDKLVSGDEFVVSDNDGSVLGKMTYLQKLGDNEVLMTMSNEEESSFNLLEGEEVKFLLTRSGRRNLLNTSAQTIVSKENPLEANVISSSCEIAAQSFVIETEEGDISVPTRDRVWAVDDEITQTVVHEYVDLLNLAIEDFQNGIGTAVNGTSSSFLHYHIPMESPLYGLASLSYTNSPIKFISLEEVHIGNYSALLAVDKDLDLNRGVNLVYSHIEAVNDAILSNRKVEYLNPRPNPRTFYAYWSDRNDFFYSDVDFTNEEGEVVRAEAIIPLAGITTGERKFIESEKSLTMGFKSINDILNISATPFTDLNIYGENLKGYNPFRTGEKGIWKSSESYVYVQDRVRTPVVGDVGDVPEIDIKNSGHMNDVTLFDPNQVFLGTCAPQWRKVSEITKYNADGYQLETKDILGIYSSALYNTKSEQLMAIGANAKYNELAFEDFEDVENKGGNFEFNYSTPPSTCTTCNSYDIISASGSKLIINMPYDETWTGTRAVELGGAKHDFYTNKEVYGSYQCSLEPLYESSSEVSESKSVLIVEDDFPLSLNDVWVGKVQVCEDLPYYAGSEVNTENISLSTTTAHTGKQSLKIGANFNSSQESTMEMRKLNLQPGQEYMLEGWTSVNINYFPDLGEESYSYNNTTSATRLVAQPKVQVGFVDESGNVTWADVVKPSGQMIDGWQRMSASFTVPKGIKIKHTLLKFYHAAVTHSGGGNVIPVYYDDLRICPKDAEMTSNVYDEFYRVTATLDARNYATFYHYDDQGSLYLTRVETEKGIRSVAYNKSHLSEK